MPGGCFKASQSPPECAAGPRSTASSGARSMSLSSTSGYAHPLPAPGMAFCSWPIGALALLRGFGFHLASNARLNLKGKAASPLASCRRRASCRPACCRGTMTGTAPVRRRATLLCSPKLHCQLGSTLSHVDAPPLEQPLHHISACLAVCMRACLQRTTRRRAGRSQLPSGARAASPSRLQGRRTAP